MAGEKIKVLIVDDVAETRENVRKLLTFEADIECVGAARSGREAIQLSQELNPDVVLMDINMPDMDGISATEQIRQRMPSVKIIILSVQSDSNYMRRAMLAGARDFLTKPPMADELISAVRRAGLMAQEEKSLAAVQSSYGTPAAGVARTLIAGTNATGKVVMFYSPKGGTGVTSLAVNFAIAINNEETPTVLVDGNLQFGDVAVFLNEQGKNSILDLAPRTDELDPEVVDSVMIKHAPSGLRVLAAPSRPEYAERVHGDQFGKLLQYLRRMFAYIVVDTTSALNEITLATLDQADLVVLSVTQDIPAIKSARLFLDLLNTIGVQRNRICFIVNKLDKRIGITPEKIGENLKQPVEAVIPLDEKIVIPSVNRGVPFVLDNKAQPCAKAVFSLAEIVRARLAKMETGDEKSARK
jgi:pilus assembly protein CpaE